MVSKQHFRIYSITYDNKDDEPNTKSLLPPFIYCEDLESRNGTYVNDVLIGIMGRERTGYLLSDGDVIEIRPYYRFRFHQPVTQETNGRNSNQSIDLQVFAVPCECVASIIDILLVPSRSLCCVRSYPWQWQHWCCLPS